MMKHRYFPLYIDISRKDILVAGAGKIALRRIKTLLKFESHITVVGKEVHQELWSLAESTDCIRVIQRQFEPEDLEGRDMVLACTDSGDVNREIVKACRERGILVNAADRKDQCDFYFPSVIVTDETVIGINGGGQNHRVVKETREYLEGMGGTVGKERVRNK